MQTIKALYGQDLLDICNEENQFIAADLNGISPTDSLVAGSEVAIPDFSPTTLKDETVIQPVKPIDILAMPNQTWIDLALQESGDENNLFDFCDLQNASPTDDVIIGTKIVQLNNDFISVLRDIRPASGIIVPPNSPQPEGIEYWGIEIDFEVS